MYADVLVTKTKATRNAVAPRSYKAQGQEHATTQKTQSARRTEIANSDAKDALDATKTREP